MAHSRGTSAAAVDKQADYTIGTGADAKLVGETLAKWTDAADINPDYYDAAMVVTALGIFEGTDGAFNATKTFTRGAAATLLAKAYNTPKTWKELGSIYVSPFNDTADSYAANGAGWAYALGFMSGTNAAGTLFSPTREITVLEYTGMLVKMLGYTLTENYKVDIIRFASEAGLFNGFQVSDPTAKITFEQAAQITVNALTAYRVTHDRNSYTGQNYDTYTKDRTPLLAYGPLGTSVNPTYRYYYEKFYSDGSARNTLAQDAFGYPGTALVAVQKDSVATVANQILGFVPHYKVLANWTAGLNAPAATSWPAENNLYGTLSLTKEQYATYATDTNLNGTYWYVKTPDNNWSYTFNGIQSGVSDIAGTDAYGTLSPAAAYSVAAAAGAYNELVSFTELGKTQYRVVSVLETLIPGDTAGYTTIKLDQDAKVGGAVGSFELPPTGYALVVRDTPTSGIISARLVTPVAVSVTSRSATTLAYTVEGAAKTAVVTKQAGDISGLNFVEGKVNIIVGDHGEVHSALAAKVSTWTQDTATYLYALPSASVGGYELEKYISSSGKATKAHHVILQTGTVVPNVTFTKAHTVINGNGAENVEWAADTFFEYVVQTDGTYALFNVSANGVTGAAAVDTEIPHYMSGTAYVTTVQDKLTNGYVVNPTIDKATTTTKFLQVGIDTSATATVEVRKLESHSGVGFQNMVYPVNGWWVGATYTPVRALVLKTGSLFGPTLATTTSVFTVHIGSNLTGWTTGTIPFTNAVKVTDVYNLANGVYEIWGLADATATVATKIGTTTRTSAVASATDIPTKDDYAVFDEEGYHKLTRADFDEGATFNGIPAGAKNITEGSATTYFKSVDGVFTNDLYVSTKSGLFYDGPAELATWSDIMGTVADALALDSIYHLSSYLTGAASVAKLYYAETAVPTALTNYPSKKDTVAEVQTAGDWATFTVVVPDYGTFNYVVVYEN
jgi:hypothetical protein